MNRISRRGILTGLLATTLLMSACVTGEVYDNTVPKIVFTFTNRGDSRISVLDLLREQCQQVRVEVRALSDAPNASRDTYVASVNGYDEDPPGGRANPAGGNCWSFFVDGEEISNPVDRSLVNPRQELMAALSIVPLPS